MPREYRGTELACQCRRCKRHGFDPWVGKISQRRGWQPTLVFLPGESHGRRSLAGYSPQGCKKLDMTEVSMHTQEFRGGGLIWDFPGGLVAKTLCSQCREPGFSPWPGNQIPQAALKILHASTKIRGSQINIRKEKKNYHLNWILKDEQVSVEVKKGSRK